MVSTNNMPETINKHRIYYEKSQKITKKDLSSIMKIIIIKKKKYKKLIEIGTKNNLKQKE